MSGEIRDQDVNLQTNLAIAREIVDDLVQRFAGLGSLSPDEQAFVAHIKGAQERLQRAAIVLADVNSGGGVYFANPDDRRTYKPLPAAS